MCTLRLVSNLSQHSLSLSGPAYLRSETFLIWCKILVCNKSCYLILMLIVAAEVLHTNVVGTLWEEKQPVPGDVHWSGRNLGGYSLPAGRRKASWEREKDTWWTMGGPDNFGFHPGVKQKPMEGGTFKRRRMSMRWPTNCTHKVFITRWLILIGLV